MDKEEQKQIIIATFRSVRPGEIVYFLPEGKIALPAILNGLADNKYAYTVRTATSPIPVFNYLAIRKEICLLVPELVQMRIAPVPPSVADKVDRAVNFLFNTDKDIFEPRKPRIDIMDRSRYEEFDRRNHIFASTVPFMGDEDDLDSDDEEEYIDGDAFCSTKSFIDSERRDPDTYIDYDLDDEHSEFIRKITELAQQYTVKFHQVPPFDLIEQTVRGRLALKAEQLSPIVVTDDFRVRLPEFNGIEIKMPPLVRIVYLLFLLHPEGIRLKEIADHHDTLLKLYSLVKRRKDFSEVSLRHIDDLTDLSDPSSLNQKISRIRLLFDRHILHSNLTERYCVSGERGELYRIDIPVEMISLPPSLTGLKEQ